MLDFFSKDPAKIVEKSSKLRLEAKYDKAESMLRKSLKNSKEDFLLLLELGRVYFEKKEMEDSAKSLRNAYYANSEGLDQIITVTEDIHYRAQVKLDTGWLLIELYLKKRNLDSVDKIMSTLKPSDIEKMLENYEKQYKEAKNVHTIDQLTKKDIETFLLTGILYGYSKKFSEAKPVFEILFKSQPRERNLILQIYMGFTKTNYGNPEPYISIGDLYLIIDDKDKAINYYEKATMLNPDLKKVIAEKLNESITDTENISESGKLSLVDLNITQKNFEKSMELLRGIMKEGSENNDEIVSRLRTIIKGDKNNAEAFKMLITILTDKRDFEGAVIQMSRLGEIAPQSADFILENIDRILQEDYKSNDMTLLKAKTMMHVKRFNDASKVLQEIYSKDKSSGFDIEEIINQILDAEPENADALSVLCSIYIDRSQTDKAKTLCEYIASLPDRSFKEMAGKFYGQLTDKFPEDVSLMLKYSTILLEMDKVIDAKSIILKAIEGNPELFYEIVPNLYEPANKSKEIAAGILNIINAMDRSRMDIFLYDFIKAELLYLSGEIDSSLKLVSDLLERHPDKEEQILGIIDRMKEKNPESEHMSEFEFKYFIAKKNYDRALEATLALYKANKLMGHVLDNLYTLYRYQPQNFNIMINILKVLDEMGLYEKIIQEGSAYIKNVSQAESGLIRFYLGKAYGKKGQVNDSATYIFQAITLEDTIIDESIEILNETLKIDFSSIKSHYALAHAYYKKKQIDRAIDELMEILGLDEKQASIIIRDLENFYEFSKSNPKLTFALGKLYMTQNDYEKAISKFKETYEIDKEYTDIILNTLKTLQESESVENGDILFLMGVLYARKGIYKMASDHLYNAMSIETSLKGAVVNQLQYIINQQPEEIYARYSLTQVYIDMRNFVQAIQLLRQIEMINPSERNNVISYYNDMLTEEPQNASVLFSLADSHLNNDQADTAIELFKKILSFSKHETDNIIDRIIEYPEKTLDIQFFLVDLYMDKTDYIGAVNWLNSIYISDISQTEKIKDKLDAVLTIEPHQQNALILLAYINYENEEYDDLISLTYDVFNKSQVQEMKFRFGALLVQAYRKQNMKQKAEEIISQMKKENADLFYAIITQLYEQEKSKGIYKLQKEFSENCDNEEVRLRYAKYLIKQKNYDEARKNLIYKFKEQVNDFERKYLLAKISEETNNYIFALEIATSLRHSPVEHHVFYLVSLLRKLGYYGEVDSIFKERPEFALTMKKFSISRNMFSENKIIV